MSRRTVFQRLFLLNACVALFLALLLMVARINAGSVKLGFGGLFCLAVLGLWAGGSLLSWGAIRRGSGLLVARIWTAAAAFVVPYVATEVTLRLYGIPEAMAAAVCSFDSLKGAIDTVIQTIQLGIPVAAALYGEAGLALHLAIVSVHGVLLLLLLTVLVELDLARARGRQQLGATLRTTARHRGRATSPSRPSGSKANR